MSLTPTQLQELQTIVLDLGEEFPHNADALWNAAIRLQGADLGPITGSGGVPAFEAAVADIKLCQEEVQTYQQRQGSPNSGFDVAVLQVVPPTSTFPPGNVGEIVYLETAPNSYVATDQIVIDPVGPNSVQMDEVGTTVARTVPAASGGFEINNLSTGGGFERVLTTSDSQVLTAEFVTLALSGQIPNERVLTGSANISVTDNGAGSTVVLDVTAAVLEPEQLFEGSTVVVNTLAQGDVTIRADVVGTTPPAPGDNFLSILDFYNITEVNRIGRVGFNGIGGNLDIFNEVHGGDVILAGEDATGVTVIGLQIDPDAITTLRGDTELQFFYGAAGNGFQVLPASDVSFRLHPRDGGAFSTDFFQYQSDNNEWEFQGDLILGDGVGVGRMVANVNVALAGVSPGTTAPVTIANNSIPASSTGSLAVTADVGTERGIFLGRSSAFHQNLTDRGPSNAEVKFDVSTDVTTDPGLYNLRMDNATPASVTEIAIDDTLLNGQDFGTYWGPNLAVGDHLFIKQVNDDSKYVILDITNVPTDSTGWWRVLVSVIASGVVFDDDEPLNVEFVQAAVSAGGGGTPGGADTNIQFNNAGAFGGSAALTWDDTNATLTIDASPGAGPAIRIDNIDPGQQVIRVGGSGSGSTNWDIIRSYDNGGANFWHIRDDHSLSAGNHKLEFRHNTESAPFIELDASGEMTLGGAQEQGTLQITGIGGTQKTLILNNGNGGLYLEEQASQGALQAGDAQIWVRNDAPNVLVFTDDAGTDWDLNVAASGVTNPMTADLDGDGFDLDDMGVLFQREQAAAETSVASAGQLWVRTDTFSNTLMFTNDNDNEFEVAGIPYNGDLLNGAGLLADTNFVGWVNIGPKPNTDYTLICQGQITAPAIDDGKVQLTCDTNSIFTGLYTDSTGKVEGIRSAIGEVITNTIVVPTDGSATDDGTFFTIIGMFQAGATGQTCSLRAAKNADGGADGSIVRPSMSVVRLVEA